MDRNEFVKMQIKKKKAVAKKERLYDNRIVRKGGLEMRVVVLSDTHGRVERIKKVIEQQPQAELFIFFGGWSARFPPGDVWSAGGGVACLWKL